MSDVNQAHLEKLDRLPEGWAESTVSEIVKMVSANKKKLAQKNYLEEGEFPVIDQGQDFIGGYSNDKDLVVEEEPPFVVFGDHTRAFKFANFQFVPGADGVKIMKPIGVDPKWSFYIFQAIKLPNKGYARHFQYLKEAYVPVPPIEQQKRIVAKIEELFSHIDAGIEALKKAKQLVKQYRQSVLKAAVTGELVGNMFPSDIFKSVEYGLESLGQGWSPKCEKEPSPSEDVWGVIKTTAVQSLEYLQEENKRLPVKLDPRPHLEVRPGDVLVTRAGPRVRVGVCCLVKETRKKLMICDKVYRLRPNTHKILPEFLEIILNAPQVQDEIGELKTGISDSGVNLTQKRFVELQIPYPDIEEQQKIVDLVYEKVDAVSRLENEINYQLGKAERNKQSILVSAFYGALYQ